MDRYFTARSFAYANISLYMNSFLNGIFAKWNVKYYTDQHIYMINVCSTQNIGLNIRIFLLNLNNEKAY